jgi:hypothetical protein
MLVSPIVCTKRLTQLLDNPFEGENNIRNILNLQKKKQHRLNMTSVTSS